MEHGVGGVSLWQIIFMVLTQIPFALVVYGWGKRREPKKGWASVVLALIPIIGYFYFYWFVYTTVRELLDKTKNSQHI